MIDQIDISTARTLLTVAHGFGDRPLPGHLRYDLAQIAEDERLPFGLRREARILLESGATAGGN